MRKRGGATITTMMTTMSNQARFISAYRWNNSRYQAGDCRDPSSGVEEEDEDDEATLPLPYCLARPCRAMTWPRIELTTSYIQFPRRKLQWTIVSFSVLVSFTVSFRELVSFRVRFPAAAEDRSALREKDGDGDDEDKDDDDIDPAAEVVIVDPRGFRRRRRRLES